MNPSAFDLLGYALPVVAGLLVAACIAHAWISTAKNPAREYFMTPKIITVCLLHLPCAGGSYWHLITGGWLTSHYAWNDPDNFNLILAVFEAFAVAAVAALIATRKPFFHVLVMDLFFIQILFGVAVVALIVLFVVTWQPRMF